MVDLKTLFPCRYEELSFIAAFLLITLIRDKALFLAYSPTYNDEFIEDFESLKTLVENLINPRKLTGERKVLTKLVAKDYANIRKYLNRLEDYLKMADLPLTLAVNDFGIRLVRHELEAKNDEGIVKELKTLFKNAEDNKLALEPKGYTVAVSAAISNLITSLTTDSVAQTVKLDSRIALTHDNKKAMNDLWLIMDQVMESGKKIAKEEGNDLMLKDYTYAALEKKVRLMRDQDNSTPPSAPQA